jgi:SnoaL-like domain
MNAEQRMAIEQQCRDLVVAATQYGDHREAEKAAALFAEDGTWLRGGRTYTGPAQIRESYHRGSATQVGRHMLGGTLVTVLDDDHAAAVTYYLAISHDPGSAAAELPLPLSPFSMGEWHDTFVRTPAGWRFATRDTRRVFERPKA